MWTKYSETVYTEESWNVGCFSPNLAQAAQEYVNTLVNEGKTDGVKHKLPPTTIRRYWLDESAAQIWVNYLESLLQQEPGVITSTSIHDNT